MSSVRLITGLSALLILVSGCEPGTSSVQFSVTAFTIETTQNFDGSVTQRTVDPAWVGPKQVDVNVAISAPITLQNIVLSYWPAGQKASSRSVEKNIDRAFNPGQGGETTAFHIEIPGADQFGMCSGIYYMIAASYRDANGTPGTFVSQPHLILPTEIRLSNSQIQQSLCAQPPGPEQ